MYKAELMSTELQRRAKPNRTTRLQNKIFRRVSSSPLLWSLGLEGCDSETSEQLERLFDLSQSKHDSEDTISRQFDYWLEEQSCGDATSVDQALIALAMTWLSPFLEDSQFQKTMTKLQHYCQTEFCEFSLNENPVLTLLRSIELPLTLSLIQFNSIAKSPSDAAAVWLEIARSNFAQSLEWLLDEAGWLIGHHAQSWRKILAVWVRCLSIADGIADASERESNENHSVKPGWLASDSRVRFEAFVKNSARMIGPDHRMLLDRQFSNSESGIAWNEGFVSAMLHLLHDNETKILTRRMFAQKAAKKEFIDSQRSSISEECQIGVLRETWEQNSILLALQFSQRDMHFELARETTLLSGQGLPEISINGKQVAPIDDWKVVCCHLENDVSFVELELELKGGVILQRHFLVAFEDRFMMLGDVVLTQGSQRIDYRNCFCLPEGINAVEERENNEIYLRSENESLAMMLPLALSEWRGNRDSHFSIIDERKIEMTQGILGTSLYAPVWIDLCPVRSLQPRTWRRLTVGQSLELVPTDIAAAFRIQIGRSQWVLYRSLGEKANRTFIGENYQCELFIGRFKKNGAEEILIVE